MQVDGIGLLWLASLSGCDDYVSILSGGVAALNRRLIADIPPGCVPMPA
jgi:hypothetical protein